MLNRITIADALQFKNALFIDVRSPSEYHDATIPKSINIPILDDRERAEVGKIYKQQGPEKAMLAGLDYVSAKLPQIYRTIYRYAHEYEHVILFCWRGGMRSKSLCTLINMLSMKNVYQLVGGYKAYRKFIIDYMNREILSYRFIMLHGLTGVGKTKILQKLQSMGKDVLDLEELARHSGSVFGKMMFNEEMPTQKMFDSYIFDVIYHSISKNVFVESESKRIGNVQIIDSIYDQMLDGYHILIETTLENRINRIVEDYVPKIKFQNEKLKESINRLRKRLSNKVTDDLLEKIEQANYIDVIRYLMTSYYDPLYQYSINRYQNYDLVIHYDQNIEETIPILIEFERSIQTKN